MKRRKKKKKEIRRGIWEADKTVQCQVLNTT
jgi:hypothetical protein